MSINKLKSNVSQVYFKRFPFSSAGYPAETLRKLKGGSRLEEEFKDIDGRTPFFAVKADSQEVTVSRSRISGVKAFKPTERTKIVEACYRTVLPFIKNNPDYLAGEEKYLAYRFSSRSIKLPYSDIKQSAVYPYFINAQKEVKPFVIRALQAGLNDGKKTIDTNFPPKSLRLTSFEEAARSLPATTNGGLPYLVKGAEYSGTTLIQDNRHLYIKIAKHLSYGDITDVDRLQNAFLSIWRGQESNDEKDKFKGVLKPKQRKPGAEGHAGTIIGARMKPFLDARAKDPRRAALVNQSLVDEVIYTAANNLKANQYLLSGDGSSYDTHFIVDIALQIAEVIIDRFQMEPQDREAMKRYFHHMFTDPLVTPEGILGGRHGMPSGTTFTNELDSCYNEVLAASIKYLPQHKNLPITLDMVTDQGDDAVMVITIMNNRSISNNKDLEELSQQLSKLYAMMNMEVNPNKQLIAKNKCEFLKRLHTSDRKESYRSYVGTAIGMCNMERAKDWKYPMYSARGIMQTANHYNNLPGFDAFMEYATKGDTEYHLGLAVKGGPHAIFQSAGGVNTVLKRLDYASYTTHLGVVVNKNEVKLSSTLSSVNWLNSRSRK